MLSFVDRFNSINLGYFRYTMTSLWAGINLCSSAEISTSTRVQSGLYNALTDIPTPNSRDKTTVLEKVATWELIM